MALSIYLFQLVVHHVRIQLGGGNVAVSHQLLQGIQIGTVFQQMHRKAVTQRVRGDLLIDPGGGLIVF